MPSSPAKEKEKEVGRVEVATGGSGNDGWLVVTFPYNKDVVEALKTALPGTQRRWDGDGKRWLVSASAGAVLVQLAKTHHWVVTSAAEALLTAAPKPAVAADAVPSAAAAPVASISAAPPVALVPAVTGSTTSVPSSAEAHSLLAVSPIDGRYRRHVKQLSDYFSEFALIKYRLKIEVEYIIALAALGLPQLKVRLVYTDTPCVY